METTIKELNEKVEQLQQKVLEMAENFNQLIDRLNNAGIKGILTFDDLEVEQEYIEEETINEEDNLV